MIERIPAAAYQRMVWKNGLGVTEQICLSPAGATLASGFDYRISRAQITEGGPFSSFPGCGRILTVIEGEGLSLARAGETIALEPLEPFAFSGDEAISAALAGSATLARGPVSDFNVIFDRARFEAECDPIELTRAPIDLYSEPKQAEHILYCVRGRLAIDGLAIESGDTARATFAPGSRPKLFALSDACAVLHARIWPKIYI